MEEMGSGTVDVGSAPPSWLADATASDPAAEVAFLEAEAAAHPPGTATRSAPLAHEAGHLRESALGLERDAARTYAQALTADPTFAPNAWALRRIFVRRRIWENLVRVCDAEIRFTPWARDADRADLQLERARLLEDRLGRDAEAAQGYTAALESQPGHAGAMLSQLLLALRAGDGAASETVLAMLVKRLPDATARAA